MAISWPKRITDRGGIRSQFHHVIDIAPTILEAVGIPQPTMINGIAQRPIEGVSMTYTWDRANANVPSQRTTQYFEIFGNRAIYHDGWMASTTPIATPWNAFEARVPADALNGYKWELYNLADDPTQTNDLASREPDRLRRMQELWMMEATRFQVLPLSNALTANMIIQRPGPAAGRRPRRRDDRIRDLMSLIGPSLPSRSVWAPVYQGDLGPASFQRGRAQQVIVTMRLHSLIVW